MSIDAKTASPPLTERPTMPIRRDDLVVVPESVRPVYQKPVPSLREIQKEVGDLKVHLERIIGQLKALSDSLNATLNG